MKGYNAAVGNSMAAEALTPTPVSSHEGSLPLSLTLKSLLLPAAANLLGRQPPLTPMK